RRHRLPNHRCIACIRWRASPLMSSGLQQIRTWRGVAMARPKRLASMSVEALFALRDDVTRILSEKAQDLKQTLARLSGGGGTAGKGRRGGASLRGRKVAPKYRGPNGETWAGRGARPRWLQAAIKEGKKPEDFLIGASRKKTAKGSRKRKSA